MNQYKGINYLRNKLAYKRRRVLTRYEYYEMKNITKYFKGMIPDELKWMKSVLGWCAKSVDTLSDRLVFHEFKNDNFNINQIFNLNNRDIFFDSAVLSA